MQIQLLKKNDPLIKTLDAAKKNYILADLLVKETYKEVHKENAPVYEQFEAESKSLDREEILNDLCDKMDATEKKFKLPQKIELRELAEKYLLETGSEIIKRISPDKWEEVKFIFEKKDPNQFAVRNKVTEFVGLCIITELSELYNMMNIKCAIKNALGNAASLASIVISFSSFAALPRPT